MYRLYWLGRQLQANTTCPPTNPLYFSPHFIVPSLRFGAMALSKVPNYLYPPRVGYAMRLATNTPGAACCQTPFLKHFLLLGAIKWLFLFKTY